MAGGNPSGPLRISIIGGGASGVLLALQLIRQARSPVQIELVERDATVGRGLAYGTSEPRHVLNVRAINMSAFAEDPGHFCRWLSARQPASDGATAFEKLFVPRQVYGNYLADAVGAAESAKESIASFRVVHGTVVALNTHGQGVAVALDDQRRLNCDIAVLAIGHERWLPEALPHIVDPWSPPADARVARDATILVQGSGLTMIDYVLSLRANGHMGRIIAISRRGLLPLAHRETPEFSISESEIPFGQGLTRLFRWHRALARRIEAETGDWRGAIDSIRPFAWRLWQGLSKADRARFLRHARPWWDIHRHRMAPQVEAQIRHALSADQLEIVAGRILDLVPEPDGHAVSVSYRRRGHTSKETLRVNRVVRCKGVVTDVRQSASPLVQMLLSAGLARSDDLGIGLDVTPTGRLIDAGGVPSTRLYAFGPLTRAALWEIIAIPDIRQQSAEFAHELLSRVPLGAT